jgi:ABC-2 type transport system ATP-binding protein
MRLVANVASGRKAVVAHAIEVHKLCKTFRKRRAGAPFWRPSYDVFRAVDRVDFTVRKGEIYGILGPNGSGKSTLIRAISTLLWPDEGTVRIFGFDVRKDQQRVRRLLHRVSVDAAFYKRLSARENLLYGARLYGVSPRVAERKAAEILSRLGMRVKALDQPLEEMSRGMQQKVAIARAFLSSPVVVLLDEPTTGLDPQARREVQNLVLELRHTHDATIILTTHDMGEAELLCDRIAFLKDGRFVAEGTPSELKLKAGVVAKLEDAYFILTGFDQQARH